MQQWSTDDLDREQSKMGKQSMIRNTFAAALLAMGAAGVQAAPAPFTIENSSITVSPTSSTVGDLVDFHVLYTIKWVDAAIKGLNLANVLNTYDSTDTNVSIQINSTIGIDFDFGTPGIATDSAVHVATNILTAPAYLPGATGIAVDELFQYAYTGPGSFIVHAGITNVSAIFSWTDAQDGAIEYGCIPDANTNVVCADSGEARAEATAIARPTNDMPEPASLALLGAGLFGLGALRRKARA